MIVEQLVFESNAERFAFGALLEIYRVKRGLGQSGFATKTGLAQSFVSRLESGNYQRLTEGVQTKLYSGLKLKPTEIQRVVDETLQHAKAMHRRVTGSSPEGWFDAGLTALGPAAMRGLLTFCCWGVVESTLPKDAAQPKED